MGATFMLWSNGRLDSAAKVGAGLLGEAGDPVARSTVVGVQADIASARGRLAEADRLATALGAMSRDAGTPAIGPTAAPSSMIRTAWHRGNRAAAFRQLDEVLKANPVAAISPIDRPFKELVDAQVIVGRIDAAKATLSDFVRAYTALRIQPDTNTRSHIAGVIALGEKEHDLAATKFRERSIDTELFCGATGGWP